MLSDIFRPFFRTHRLASASEAVRLHDGSITAQNRERGGLQVTITLPLRIPAREEDLQHSMNEA
jgi:signal transduction histidine kinase